MNRTYLKSTIPSWIALCCVALLAVGCSINPATGKRQLTLIGEDQEIALGLQNDRAIVGQMGLYGDEALQDYIQDLGSTMAAQSERPQLDWTFRVVDDPIVNAFALPGGFIYITRGIMAHMNSEAELASVVGHEIGHVTARHGVNQMSKAQLANLGMGLGMVLAPEAAQNYGGMAQQGLGLLFLKYGRDDEHQADELGLRYITRTGFDARPMPSVFLVLKSVGDAAGAQPLPNWLSTHPAPEQRYQRLTEMIQSNGVDYSGKRVDREGYLNRLDGMIFGPDPRQGFFEGDIFHHPDMKFRLSFPSGWQRQNQRSAVVAVSSEQDAMLQLTLAEQDNAAAALTAFFAQSAEIQRGSAWRNTLNGKTAASAYFQIDQEQGSLRGLIAFVEHNGQVFQLFGYTPSDKWSLRSSAIEQTLGSFAQENDSSILAVQPKRIKIVRSTRNRTLQSFAQGNGATVDLATLALINQLDPADGVKAGELYKLVVGGR